MTLALLAVAAALVVGLTDRELVARVAQGDRGGLKALYDAAAPRALAVVLRLLKDRAEAEDVLQETFLEVWRRAGEYDERRGSAAAWVATLARSRALDRLRSRATRQRTVEAAAAVPDAAAPATPLEMASTRQERERVLAALQQLPAEQRLTLERAYFDGLSQREISEATGEPLGTVKTRVRLAMQKLAQLLAEETAA